MGSELIITCDFNVGGVTLLALPCLVGGALDLASHFAFKSESFFIASCKFILSEDSDEDGTERSASLDVLAVEAVALSCIWILTSGF